MQSLRKDLFLSFRSAAVLVGTLVGAGYASGREVSQYFGSAGISTVLLSALLIALLSMLFMWVGRVAANPDGLLFRFYRLLLVVVSVVSAGAMLSASTALLGGVFTALLVGVAGVLLCFWRPAFHLLNMVAVPLLVVLVSVVARGNTQPITGQFLPLAAINYAGMNMLLEAELMRREGRGMSSRAILLSGVWIAVVMAALLLLMRSLVGASTHAMPFAALAAYIGLSGVVSAAILSAVLTNTAGAMYLCVETLTKPPRGLTALLALLAALLVGSLPFSWIVAHVYPVLGWLGLAISVGYVVWGLLALFPKERRRLLFVSKRG